MSSILGININGKSYSDLADKCVAWAKGRESRAVFFANVHMIMEAFDDGAFRAELNSADIVNPDGVPLVWALRAIGKRNASRVYGPDATEILLKKAEDLGLLVGFYGASQVTLDALLVQVQRMYPNIKVAFAMSPPFRPLEQEEDEKIVQEISASGTELLFVGLGCPKQERWIVKHRGRIPAVMLGVGAAFDFLAHSKSQAPRWMMDSGLEWLYRLATEPRRLAGRYLRHNPRFVALFLQQYLRQRMAWLNRWA